ncbi:MAG: hypothetical protein FWH15_01095 [Betaproteobacteria bacterium]|nr:hypothetical protein [Betaproteobacteria bacterium]
MWDVAPVLFWKIIVLANAALDSHLCVNFEWFDVCAKEELRPVVVLSM